MGLTCQIAATLAGLVHLGIFYLESVTFSRPATYRRFLISDDKHAEMVAPWAFNQGFYNLFLAIGTFTGVLVWAVAGKSHQGRALIGFGCACMLAAALVLLGSDRRMARAAAVQGVLPLVALITLWSTAY
jgi:putative membrane protein